MGRHEKLLLQILRGTSDANVPFEGLCALLVRLGFEERIRGGHHIFIRGDVDEILNLQPRGPSAKVYQVKQVREEESLMKPEYRYEVIIYWSGEDGSFIAEVPELPGCAADGVTYEEVVENVQLVIGEWIETAREIGRPIPEPRGRLLFA